ncbi:MAG: hypothetical protein R3C18_27865 [Planctomycetaceae bacterium]
MANFRVERILVTLDESIPDFNHLEAVDAEELAWLNLDSEAESRGLTPLNEFAVAPFQRPQWHSPSDGLETVRGLAQLCERWLGRATNPYGYTAEIVQKKLLTLRQLEEVLVRADECDRSFHLALRDLE